MEPFGIKMTCVCHGRFRADFLDAGSVRFGDIEIKDYKASSLEKRATLAKLGNYSIAQRRGVAHLSSVLMRRKADCWSRGVKSPPSAPARCGAKNALKSVHDNVDKNFIWAPDYHSIPL